MTQNADLAVSGRWYHWHRRLYDWVLGWADTKYGMAALITIAVAEPIFLPIPADIMLIGMSLGKPRRALRYGLITAFFSVLGGTIAFLLGVLIGGERVVDFFAMISAGPLALDARAAQALEFYEEYDFWAISISALTPVPYMLFSWVGGMAGVSLGKFVVISLVFRTMRFGGEAMLFYIFGERAKELIDKYFNMATVVVIVLLMIVVWALKAIGGLFAV